VIVVVGGTGTLGKLLVPRLVGHGDVVRVVSRRVNRRELPDGVEARDLDVSTPAGAAAAVTGARVVVSAITGFSAAEGVERIDGDGNRLLADAAAAHGVEHLVLLSVAQAAPDHPIPLFRAKWAAEEAVRASGVPWTIVRPTAYLETWLGLIGGPLATDGRTTVFGKGRNPINFVSARDVAAVVERVIADPAYRSQVVEVPGPDNLTLDDLVTVAAAAAGREGRAAHVPRLALRFLSVALRPINPTRAGQVTTALVMDTKPMSADAAGRSIRDGRMTSAPEVAQRLFSGAEAHAAGS
jgi:uncharacterized protein YbjT (DUF2867 family)